MSSYQEALRSFLADVQHEIEVFMGRWQAQSEKGANLVPNIEREQFLPPDCPDPTCSTSCMKSILQKILENRHLPFNEVESRYRVECYKHAGHGWTKPWQREWLRRDSINCNLEPKPEAVHQPEEFRYLRLPVELAHP
jgi:hypothetical protein